MDEIKSYEQIAGYISSVKQLKQGFITNFYLDRDKTDMWAAQGILWCVRIGDVFFVLKKQDAFYGLYYIAPSLQTLETALELLVKQHSDWVMTTDILGNEQVLPIREAFGKLGFESYAALVRMSRMGPVTYADTIDETLSVAGPDDAATVMSLLHQYFDPLSEQLPLPVEIARWQADGRILVSKDGDQVTGFVIYELNGVTLFLRYWFVHPDYRDRKIGSKLFNLFFKKGQQSKRQLFWVKTDNENAIKRYRHFGFAAENMFDHILIKRKETHL